ncbi:RDD family protein [uncultured Actinomyces sp.]|jgi:RDD family protein|uniref:RDD family protein n=1 Tax=uncultured Actinomyces sp. TaxID=249061 RepID=UPI00261F6F56|nr:RDD family protein [uncultured Actinomyces sp.]
MSAQRIDSSDFQDDYVRTGEAVSLDVSPASPMERIASATIDGTTYMGAMFIILLIAVKTWSGNSESALRIFIIALTSSTLFFVPFAVEVATGGRSLGKWAMNLRVVRDDGGPITARHSAVRVGVGIVENWLSLGAIALASEFLSSKGKRLGDLAAGTMVCSQGSAVFYPPLVMPPGLEVWAATATILPLDDELVAEARAFLGTNRSLNRALRIQVATSLADRLSRRVQTPLPEGLHPELVIAAVLVARRDREWSREIERRHRGAQRFHEATKPRFGL